jgi:hypothetical protein
MSQTWSTKPPTHSNNRLPQLPSNPKCPTPAPLALGPGVSHSYLMQEVQGAGVSHLMTCPSHFLRLFPWPSLKWKWHCHCQKKELVFNDYNDTAVCYIVCFLLQKLRIISVQSCCFISVIQEKFSSRAQRNWHTRIMD